MKAEETVVHSPDCKWHGYITGGCYGDKKIHYDCTCGRPEQAEISFKAGIEEAQHRLHSDEIRMIAEEALMEQRKVGRKEVVDWIASQRSHSPGFDNPYIWYMFRFSEWQAKLKEWE